MSQANNIESLRLFRASPIGDREVQQVTIEIHDEMPECNSTMTLTKYHQLHVQQGAALADVLFQSLPGGTIDELLAEMMVRRASLFRIPFVTSKEGQGE